LAEFYADYKSTTIAKCRLFLAPCKILISIVLSADKTRANIHCPAMEILDMQEVSDILAVGCEEC
jgi:hypothetical protein